MPQITRRHVLTLSGKSIALLSFANLLGCSSKRSPPKSLLGDKTAPGQAEENTPNWLSWDDFITELERLASQQHQDKWNQEHHVTKVAELLSRLAPSAQPVLDIMKKYLNNSPNFPEMTAIHKSIDFEVTVLQFETGEVIDLHNHPDMSGVIQCIRGDITIDGYNLLKTTAENGNLLIEKINSIRMAPGDITSLTAKRGNIHALVAHEYTELLDVFTPPYAGDRIHRYRWYARADTPISGSSTIYEAWET